MIIASGAFLMLLIIGVPVAFAMAAAALLFFLGDNSYPSAIFAQRLIGGVNSFPFLAVPFFIMAGTIMNATSLAQRLIDFADALVGHFRGGLGQVSAIFGMMFGTVSGSSTADAALMSKLLVPQMVRHGYPLGFSAALAATTSVITSLIPPSVGLVIYGFVSNTSIARLLLAGIVPGIVTTVVLMQMVRFLSIRGGFGSESGRRFSARAALRAGRRASLALLLPVLIVGGISAGLFTPTEAAAVTAVYALLVGLLLTRDLRLADVGPLLAKAGRDTASIAMILAVAGPFAWMLTVERIPHQASEMLTELATNPWILLLIVNLFLLVLGTALDPGPTMIVVVPILMPAIHALGIDPVHFGVVVVFNSLLGAITPPSGTILFAVLSITRIGMTELTRWMLPQFAVLLGLLALFTYLPQLSVWLPDLILGPAR